MSVWKHKNEIAVEYGVNRKTLYNRLKRRNISLPRGLLSLEQQKIIYDCLGYPAEVNKKDYDPLMDEKENKEEK